MKKRENRKRRKERKKEGDKMRLLVVDDSGFARSKIARLIRNAGHEVHGAESGFTPILSLCSMTDRVLNCSNILVYYGY